MSAVGNSTTDRETLRALADEGDETALDRLADLADARGDPEELGDLLDEGSARAGVLLTRRAVAEGDLGQLQHLHDAGSEEAGRELQRLLAGPGTGRARLGQVVVDSTDPARLARFWGALLGAGAVDRARGWSHVEAPGFPRISFQPVPEDRSGGSRLHLDVEVDDVEAAAAEAVALGATRVGEPVRDDRGAYQVMADPEGNAFCFVRG